MTLPKNLLDRLKQPHTDKQNRPIYESLISLMVRLAPQHRKVVVPLSERDRLEESRIATVFVYESDTVELLLDVRFPKTVLYTMFDMWQEREVDLLVEQPRFQGRFDFVVSYLSTKR